MRTQLSLRRTLRCADAAAALTHAPARARRRLEVVVVIVVVALAAAAAAVVVVVIVIIEKRHVRGLAWARARLWRRRLPASEARDEHRLRACARARATRPVSARERSA